MNRTAPSSQNPAYLKLRELIAQNSAFLAAFNELPGTEQETRLLDTRQQEYQLTIDREKELSEGFAFLAARKEDPNNVMAVAIEEDLDKCGMTIRVATNEGDLTGVKAGLSDIAEILERAATRCMYLTSAET